MPARMKESSRKRRHLPVPRGADWVQAAAYSRISADRNGQATEVGEVLAVMVLGVQARKAVLEGVA